MCTKATKKDFALSLLISALCVAATAFFVANYCVSLFFSDENPSAILLIVKILIVFFLMIFYNFMLERQKSKLFNKTAELLAQSEQRYRLYEEFSDNVHFDADIKNDRISFNSNFECLFGQMPGISKISEWRNLLAFIALEDLQVIINAWEKVIGGSQQSSADIRIIDADGHMLWFRLTLVAQYNNEGEAFRVLGRLVNIDSQVRQIRRLHLKSMKDPMTRLFHRMASEALVDDFLKGEGKRGKHAMLIIDVDNFKEVNDSFGHCMVDSVLVSLSKAIRKVFRSSDICGRLGGDEFMVFLRDIPSDYILEYKIRELFKPVNSLNIEGNGYASITCSVGVSIYNKDGTNFAELYQTAARALYNTKFSGKNSFSFYSMQETQKICGT